MYKTLNAFIVIIAATVLTACEVKKSSNPLSPSVAGPIPGVNITTPAPASPTPGARIAVNQQPITLSVTNATTTGVRPLSYVFEVASDAQFAAKVFTKSDVAPGASGRTSVTLAEALPTDRTYYWRALAKDGANTGVYTAPLAFSIYTPIAISAPQLVSPINGQVATSSSPKLTLINVTRSGPVGQLTYEVWVYKDATLTTFVWGWSGLEGPGQTVVDVPINLLTGDTTYYWAARAKDPTVAGPASAVQSFRTPAVILPPAPAPIPGGGGGGGGTDFDGLGNVRIVAGSPDVRSWAVTSSITSLRFSPGNIHLEHTKTGQWPGVDIGGALQEMTLWVFFKINGQWYGTGGERWRPGQTDKALSAPSAIGPGWFYNGTWDPMTGYVPRPGEQVGFMVVAGSTRVDNRAPVKERSNILMIPFPADGVSASFP